ncbi:MAG: UvrD-helicase domain-containing protein [Gammaproteobacteria bacterium]|nr:UvrD-helicase domain-containing protein [Gammaproteobacteria bacterium]
MSDKLVDQAARDEALDVSRSFIVQAPAGSGKTGLLTLRFLRLLAFSEQPEEVLAITFTRKAASEMRDRIIQTLYWAEEMGDANDSVDNEFDRQRLSIARAALARDKQQQWQLLLNPTRLRIQTIDSFCFYLASQLPVLSRIGGNPKISEEVEHCFRDAINNTLMQLDSKRPISNDIELVLLHLDNDIGKLERLLINLLKKRDQWLAYILEINNSGDDALLYFQTCIKELIEEATLEVQKELVQLSASLLELTNFALSNLQNSEPPKHVAIKPLNDLPGNSIADVKYWCFITDLLLTQDGVWRRTVNKLSGFPTGAKNDKEHQALCKLRKQQMKELLEQLTANDDLRYALNYLRLLPDSSIDKQQWSFITSLTRVLAQLSSELLISFRRFRVIDYTETGAAARSALEADGNPTDLALALDHKIQHILIDEFQDTSQLQLDILQQLIAGWESGDQRSLFLVGDAMQSCYGFRNANVGIYLRVQQNGLPQRDIQALKLEANFRSDANIVQWLNQHFNTAFPAQANPSRGAVPYSSSMAVKQNTENSTVSTELIGFAKDDRLRAKQMEADRVVASIKTIRKRSPEDSIAILVRSRGHLDYIIPALRDKGIEWNSTDIDRMGSVQIIEDLLSLTRALLNPYDRLSWLAILRAPWTGVKLSDLLSISQLSNNESVWQTISNPVNTQQLSDDGQERIDNFVACVKPAMQVRLRVPLRTLVTSCWELLRGAAAIQHAREESCVEHYLDLLEEAEIAGGIGDFENFQEAVYNSFVPGNNNSNPEDNAVQLLTMHKAKGLEFDHVIIPGLANRPGSDDKPLFTWHERINRRGQSRLFVAAQTETGADDDALYQLILHERQHKTLLENTRLLYIAITRARKSAKLLATVPLSTKQELQVSQLSLLHCIWRELQRESVDFQITMIDPQLDKAGSGQVKTPEVLPTPTPLRRFCETEGLSESESRSLEQLISIEKRLHPENSEQQEDLLSACMGELIHQTLEEFGNCDEKNTFIASVDSLRDYFKLQLQNKTNSPAELDTCLDFVTTAITQTISSKEFDWVFDHTSTDSHCEYSVSILVNGKIQTHIIDRTFIDEQGVRWIIDYKSGTPKNEDECEFIARQKRAHSPQLNRYKNLFGLMEKRETKTALLLTAIPRLVEV